jgi:hypothetical protein
VSGQASATTRYRRPRSLAANAAEAERLYDLANDCVDLHLTSKF